MQIQTVSKMKSQTNIISFLHLKFPVS